MYFRLHALEEIVMGWMIMDLSCVSTVSLGESKPEPQILGLLALNPTVLRHEAQTHGLMLWIPVCVDFCKV